MWSKAPPASQPETETSKAKENENAFAVCRLLWFLLLFLLNVAEHRFEKGKMWKDGRCRACRDLEGNSVWWILHALVAESVLYL